MKRMKRTLNIIYLMRRYGFCRGLKLWKAMWFNKNYIGCYQGIPIYYSENLVEEHPVGIPFVGPCL